MFGAIGLDNRQIFREYDRFNEITLYEFLKQLPYKFPKCCLFLGKASSHYKLEKVRRYFDEHKHSLISIWLPTASPEFMVLEECWNISKNDLLVLTYYASFTGSRKGVGHYFKTKHFNLNIRTVWLDICQRIYINWYSNRRL
jgi:hypothetical protein